MKLTEKQHEAVRAYLRHPYDGSKAHCEAKDRVFDAFVRADDRSDIPVQARISRAIRSVRKTMSPGEALW